MRALLVLATLVVATTPGAEDDLSFADKTEARAEAPTVEQIEAYTSRSAPDAKRLDVERGGWVFVETEIRLKRPAPPEIRLVPLAVRSDRGVSTAPWAELVHAEGRVVRARYVVRGNDAGPEDNSLRFVLDVQDARAAASVGRARVEHTVRLTPTVATPERLALDAAAFAHHQALAKEAYRGLPELKDYLRLDRVDRPPSPKRTPDGKEDVLQAFLRNRLRADLARRHLRAAAELEDPALAKAAARALGGLTEKPTGPAAQARAIEGVTTDKGLEMAARALDDLEVDVAEGFLNRLRTSGRLTRPELARSLALLGGVYFLRGKDAAAARAYGGALCIEPSLETTLERGLLKARFQEAKAAGGCPSPLSVVDVKARRELTEAGPVVVLDATLSADPHRVFSGGEVQRWGFGGRADLRETASVEQIDGAPHLVARLPDDENSATTDRLIVKVLVKDVSGVVLASFGDPDPRGVVIENAEVSQGGGVPGWVWIVAGGVALVGGASVGIWALSQNDEVQRGIGPTEVRF